MDDPTAADGWQDAAGERTRSARSSAHWRPAIARDQTEFRRTLRSVTERAPSVSE